MQKEKTTVDHSKNDLADNVGNTGRPHRKTEVAQKTRGRKGDKSNKIYMEIDDEKLDAKTNKTAGIRGPNANKDDRSDHPSFAMSQAANSVHTKPGSKAKKQMTRTKKVIDQVGATKEEELQPLDRQLSVDEIQLISDNWYYLENTYGLQKVGTIIMKQVFQEDQSILHLLPYKGEQNVLKNQQLLEHALHITQCISRSVEHLSDFDGQAKHLKKYGKQLMQLGITEDHYNSLKKGILNMLGMGLQQKFSPQAK